tara:strand:- start:89 stop:418 length:330 start_codon:yes stop_codon:yes gene_type:complete
MKKILLLLITLTTFTNVSYASFPVTETQQTEIVEVITSNSTEVPRNGWLNIYGVASLLLFILALFFVLMIVVGIPLFSISGPDIANYIAYAIYSTIAAIVLGIISFVKK